MSEGARREHVGGIVGIGIGLLLIPLLALSVMQSRAQSLDGESLVRELFEADPLPYGMQVTEAAAVPGGDRFVILERPTPEEELRGTAEEAHPNQVVLVYYKSAKAVNDAFSKRSESTWGGGDSRRGRGRGGDMGHGGGGGDGATVIESGTLEWSVWRANYVHTRRTIREERDEEPEPDGEAAEGAEEAEADAPAPVPIELGPTRDMIRVNLSAGSKYCVAYASWPLNVQATADEMEELLEGLEYRPPAESVAAAAEG